jgi:hypothetical protein
MPFEKGNKLAAGKGRPQGSGFSAQLREVVGKDEFKRLVQSLLDRALEGDTAAAGVLINRLVPTLRPVALPEPFPLTGDSLAERAMSVLDAAAGGQVSSVDAKAIIDALAGVARIREVDELERRVAALESR